MYKKLALLAGMGVVLGGCLYQPVQPHGEELRAQSGAVAPDLAGFSSQASVNAGSHIHPLIRAYLQDIKNDELEFCDGNRGDDPTNYCYSSVDEAFVKAHVAYQDDDIALITLDGVKGFEGSGGYSGDVISLRGNTPHRLDSVQGGGISLQRKGNRVTLHYSVNRSGKNVAQKKVIKL